MLYVFTQFGIFWCYVLLCLLHGFPGLPDSSEGGLVSGFDGICRLGGRSGLGGFWKRVPRRVRVWNQSQARAGDEGGRRTVIMSRTQVCP